MTVARILAAAVVLSLGTAGPTWAVGSTPVTVVNPENSPVPVRDAGQPQPVSGACTYFPVSGTSCSMYTVPAGKRLIVELFSFRLAAPAGGGGEPSTVFFGKSGVIFCFGCLDIYALPPGNAYSGSSSFTVWADTRPVRLYLDENDTFSARANFNGSNNFGQAFTFSGFLVNK